MLQMFINEASFSKIKNAAAEQPRRKSDESGYCMQKGTLTEFSAKTVPFARQITATFQAIMMYPFL